MAARAPVGADDAETVEVTRPRRAAELLRNRRFSTCSSASSRPRWAYGRRIWSLPSWPSPCGPARRLVPDRRWLQHRRAGAAVRGPTHRASQGALGVAIRLEQGPDLAVAGARSRVGAVLVATAPPRSDLYRVGRDAGRLHRRPASSRLPLHGSAWRSTGSVRSAIGARLTCWEAGWSGSGWLPSSIPGRLLPPSTECWPIMCPSPSRWRVRPCLSAWCRGGSVPQSSRGRFHVTTPCPKRQMSDLITPTVWTACAGSGSRRR
jgi:hypothetical protein